MDPLSEQQPQTQPVPAPQLRRRWVPLWVKWLLGMLALSFFVGFASSGPDGQLLLPAAFFGLLVLFIIFPGSNPQRPILLMIMVALWSISLPFLAFVVLGALFGWSEGGVELARGELALPMVVAFLILRVALLTSFAKRSVMFGVFVLVNALVSVATEAFMTDGSHGPSIVAFGLWTLVESVLAFYLVVCFNKMRRLDAEAEASEPVVAS